MFTFGSLFAGVGGADLGFEAAGMECSWQVENDPACQQVLQYHWPNVPLFGDISEVNGADLPPVDVIVYGFPCQDLSVAGKRAGLDGERSGLFFEAVRIITEMKEATNGEFPKWTVAENVAGLLSADKGAAMGRCLDTLAEAGALVSEWCLVDAQFFGVPQRRRRVFLASCFDSGIAGQCPDEIFAIAESGSGNPPTLDTARQTPAPSARGSAEGSRLDLHGGVTATPMQDGTKFSSQNGIGVGKPDAPMYTLTSIDQHAVAVTETDVVGPLTTGSPAMIRGTETADSNHILPVVETFRMKWLGEYVEDEVASPVKARDHKDPTDLVSVEYPQELQEVTGTFTPGAHPGGVNGQDAHSDLLIPFVKSRRARSSEDHESWIEDAPAPTLNSFENTDTRATTAVVQNDESVVFTAQRVGEPPRIHEDAAPSLLQRMGTGGNQTPLVAHSSLSVRRLTPLECERLQGWPDDFTRYRADGKEQKDSPRYKQIGNGVAAPVAEWIAQQILATFSST